ncbi:MAG: hypothetical protein K0S47_4692 [Herbinix sp.]|nr:hypothetical protein [Herbinix sp.]
MNNKWSEYVQTSEELYRSRALRFNDINKNTWLSAMLIKDGMDVLEVGCGGGIFCHRIKTYLPNTQVTGIDYDTGHIEYANKKTKELGCTFVNGDALAMPFTDQSFDLCYSHTVMEHIEPNAFVKEQYRVLKKGGKIVILSVRSGLNIGNELFLPVEQEERSLLEKAYRACKAFESTLEVCKYPITENEFPSILENAGFQDVNINFFTIMSYIPDNADVSVEMAEESINVNRLHAKSSFYTAMRMCPDALTDAELKRAFELIDTRFDKRIKAYRSGTKLWDMSTSSVLVVTGVK